MARSFENTTTASALTASAIVGVPISSASASAVGTIRVATAQLVSSPHNHDYASPEPETNPQLDPSQRESAFSANPASEYATAHPEHTVNNTDVEPETDTMLWSKAAYATKPSYQFGIRSSADTVAISATSRGATATSTRKAFTHGTTPAVSAPRNFAFATPAASASTVPVNAIPGLTLINPVIPWGDVGNAEDAEDEDIAMDIEDGEEEYGVPAHSVPGQRKYPWFTMMMSDEEYDEYLQG